MEKEPVPQQNIEVASEDDLRRLLVQHDIDFSGWGSEQFFGTKTTKQLYEELDSGASRLTMQNGELTRFRTLVAFNIYAYEQDPETKRASQWYKLSPHFPQRQQDSYPGELIPSGSRYSIYRAIMANEEIDKAFELLLSQTKLERVSNAVKAYPVTPDPIDKGRSNTPFYPGLPVSADVYLQKVTLAPNERDLNGFSDAFIDGEKVILKWRVTSDPRE